MPGALLTTASSIKCPHGGTAVLITTNATTSAGARVLLESDIHSVFGCTFTVGTKYQPCLSIAWSAAAGAVEVHGTKVLLRSSIGACKPTPNGTGITQGVALISSTQQKATGR